MEITILLLSSILFLFTLLFTFQIIKNAKALDLSYNNISKNIFRGMIKHLAYDTLNQKIQPIIKRWLLVVILFLISTITYLSYKVWGTDYSFLIVLYPLVVIYYFSKYLVWEKLDILERQSKSEDDKGFIRNIVTKIKNKNNNSTKE